MKKLLLIFVALVISFAAYAQETVTLVVNGEGTTKEEATANALRSAIEQAFGVFVSANTQILNDEIVKDEIATISSGNIKEYKELGTITLPDGRKSISLSATVSIKNLISYAKSKGSSTEFAGAVWGMNIKMRKLNAENERMAVDHMLEQLDILSRDMFKIELSSPNPPVKINWDDYQYSDLKKSYSSQPYSVDFNLTYYSTPTFKLFFDFLFNSLQSISLSDDEVKAYKESGEPMYELRTIDNGQLHIVKNDIYYLGENKQTYYFRNDIVETIISSISVSFRNALLPHWQIVRSSTDKGDESITFKNYWHSWQSYPKNRFVKWSKHPLVTEASNSHIGFGFLPNMMTGDETQLATFNIKIGFTEDELINTTGFEIKKLEDFDVNNIQPSNEIWCTFTSYSKRGMGSDKEICTYNAKNRCWIFHYNGKLIKIGGFSNSSLTSITIPNSVTSIEWGAFQYCTNLTSITIPNSVSSIGNGAFVDCTGLTSITIPNSVSSIGNAAFAGCTGLTSITIPNSVTSISYLAFKGCTGLTSITFPNSVTKIEKGAFAGCTGLTSITIPNSVTSIEEGAFTGCTGLTSITIPNSVTSIRHETFAGCTGLTSITIPNSVTKIDNGAFEGCTGLTSITIPNSVTSIGHNYVGNGPFAGCTGLTSITIPNSVTSIGNGAFAGCTGLTSITFPNSVYSIGSNVFLGTSQECIAYVPIGRAEYYKDMLSRCGFKGSVVEISETDSLSQ